jgi:DNA invertase Pin-like site-specific DNA recombinase
MVEKITKRHLDRVAIVYVRQSSTQQVVHNEESRRLQYAMKQRVELLGWRDVITIDDDMGRSAATTSERSGFQRMVAEVCLGRIGTVAAREVSRFARNNRDWHQLIEMCALVETLLIDHEAVYDPRSANDRLLLGLKGTMSEYELDLLRQRSLEARVAKAKRGELVIEAPVGFLKTSDQRLEKNPDARVQRAIRLVFEKFFELGSARQTLMWFLEQGLDLPSHRRGVTRQIELHWQRPTYGGIMGFLAEPTYAGAYGYGRTEARSCVRDGVLRKVRARKPVEEWMVLIPDHHEGYIDWSGFQRAQRMLHHNASGFLHSERRGATKRGDALLAGLLRCRRCGRPLMVNYSGKGGSVPRYECRRGWIDNAEPKCIGFGGLDVDDAVSLEVLRVVRPLAVDAAVRAAAEDVHQRDDLFESVSLELQEARYAADRARRQFDAVDPENRLVADELEIRWNLALQKVRDLDDRIQGLKAQHPPAAAITTEPVTDLDRDLERAGTIRRRTSDSRSAFSAPSSRMIVADIDSSAHQLEIVIHWKGGIHTLLQLPHRRRGQSRAQTLPNTIETIRSLALVCDDEVIASFLNRNGLRTGRGNRWTRERIASARSEHEIPRHTADRQRDGGWLKLKEAAAHLCVSAKTLRIAVERGEIAAVHPLPDGPWIFRREDLDKPSARALVRHGEPGRQSLAQLALGISNT